MSRGKEREKNAMTIFEIIMTILNLIAVLLIPVVAVFVGQYLQERAQRRKDKMDIFKTLMINRVGWSVESTRDPLKKRNTAGQSAD